MNDPKNDLDALFALARKNRPNTSRAEYAFETRLMARLRAERKRDAGSVWAMVSWRMAPFFTAIVVALGVWQSEMIANVTDTIDTACLQNPSTFDLWNSLN